MHRARLFAVAAAIGACALAGCGGGSGTAASPPVVPQEPLAPSSAATLSTSGAAHASGPVALGRYRIDPRAVFVAGISSGGFFAVQMHVAHSATIKGAAIYAGGVYYCANGNVITALTDCGGETVNGQALYEYTLPASEAYLDAQSAARHDRQRSEPAR